MRIALIQENTQKKQNDFVYGLLTKIAQEYGHTVYNFGVKSNKEYEIDYVQAGVLTGILLSTHTVDFVITGCMSGQGVMLVANKMPNVLCGYVTNSRDVSLFLKINGGNAISIPFGMLGGPEKELLYEQMFRTLFSTSLNIGYPEESAQKQEEQRVQAQKIMQSSQKELYEILDQMDKDFLRALVHNEFFEEYFFAFNEDDEVSSLLKALIDD